MKIVLLTVGKTTDKHLIALIDDYVSRTSHYVSFSVETLPELKNTKALSTAQQKAMEAEMIKGALQAGDYIVLLDEHGRERRSVEFAQWIQKRMVAGGRRIVFIIGGPYGFDASIHELASEEISLSQMTFSHQMVRLFFAEQIYRAMTILNNEPYHHE